MRIWEQEVDNTIEEMIEQYGVSYTIELHAICSEENISLRLSHVIDIGDRCFKYPFKQVDGIANIITLDQVIMESAGHLISASVPVLIYKEVK